MKTFCFGCHRRFVLFGWRNEKFMIRLIITQKENKLHSQFTAPTNRYLFNEIFFFLPFFMELLSSLLSTPRMFALFWVLFDIFSTQKELANVTDGN